MEPKKFSVHNQTRETALSASVTTVNAALEPLKVLKVLIEGLPASAKSGLWLTNFKGVPVARTLSPFDLVYLDKENRVILGVELSKDGEFTPPKGQPASALVLPPKSLTQSATRAGDQLEFQPAAIDQPEPVATPAQTSPAQTSLPPTPPAASLPDSSLPDSSLPPAPSLPPALGPNFFSSLGAQPAPPSESSGSSAAKPTAESGSGPPASFPDILRRGTPAPSPSAFPDTPRSPLLRPAAEPPSEIGEPAAPSPDPNREPFWPRPSAAERSHVVPLPAPGEEPHPEHILFATPSPVAPIPVEAPPGHVPERPKPKRKYPLKVRLLRWLFPDLVIKEAIEPQDRRRADRQSLPGLIAYYFTGGSPEAHKIANISVLGFYLQTDERWMPGTVVRMTLQRLGSTGEDPSDTITVNSRIVRWGADGEGFEFILTDLED